MNTFKIAILGYEQDSANASQEFANDRLILKNSVVVSSYLRGGTANKQILQVEKNDIVELIFDDNTRWLTPPDLLEEIYPGKFVQSRDGEAILELPTDLQHPDKERSVFDTIALKVVNLFTKKAVGEAMDKLAEVLEEKQIGSLRGLLRITKDFQLVKADAIDSAKPFVLFIHGTNSSTLGSFEELKGSGLWDYITESYGNNILAFQHETLTKSPLRNTAELVKQLPANAELHVITHSRGGLIGEVLSRFSNASNVGFSEQEVELLKKENREVDVEHIRSLQKSAPQKKFIVSKYIRVACPAGGTTILSKRVDYFFNISLNLLGFIPGFAGNPVYVAMKNLLIAAVDEKNNISVLPGLEAMKPDSPFITVLNNQSSNVSLDRPVVAISGNCKTKVNFKALVIIASKLFFAEANDLVVNTKSMYTGSKRMSKLQFFFDEGTDVDHFHYFKNPKTNLAILLALKSTSDSIDGFTEFWRGTVGVAERNAVLGLDGGEYATEEPSGKKPIVILLPGIMGSAFTNENGLVWINYLKFLTGGLGELSLENKHVKTTSIIKSSYKKLGDALVDKYDVVTFAFDWRTSLTDAAKLFDEKIQRLSKLNQPIKIIGHSMGGVLVRDFMVFYPETWERLKKTTGFQLIFLGSPLGGSFRINNVLFGEDNIISKLSKIDIVHTKKTLIKMFATFPGILCLLPFNNDADNDFADLKVWENMKLAAGDESWPLPSKDDLAAFKAYRDNILQTLPNLDYQSAVYVAGHDAQTPCGYRIDETSRGTELVFLSTAEGDQSVTWESGIPKKMIAAGKVYYTNYSHGALSNTPALFGAFKEILEKGQTNLLSKIRPAIRGDKKIFRTPATVDFDFSPEGLTNTLLGLPTEDIMTSSELPIEVKVSHGDLKYCTYPVLAGHFNGDGILYAEERLDKLLGGVLIQQHKLGLYPGPIGTHEIQLTHYSNGFQGAIIIGLGEPDSLTGFELSRSVELSIEKYLIKQINKEDLGVGNQMKHPLGISSLVIACGYGGLSVESSISSVLQGILNANKKITLMFNERAKRIECVEIVELYENTAISCLYAINRLNTESGGSLNITANNFLLNKLPGARKRLIVDNNYDWWKRITVKKIENKKGAVAGMSFSISTNAAREDLRTLYTSTGIVESLIWEISTDNNWTAEKARAIYELLIPNDFKARLKKHENIIWILDSYTAEFPWELLQDMNKDADPICIHAGMIRQLATQNSRLNIEYVPTMTALIVGDPELDGYLPSLPGAFKEASEVGKLLKEHNFQVRSLLNESAGVIIPALFSGYKVVHLAGHGLFDEDPEKPSGMVIGKNSFLTAADIAQMSTTPELVFVNCCFLGKTSGIAEEFFQARFKFAANIGTQLINNGVKAVIVAGWAVDDTAALVFAQKFYEIILQGKTFGQAVRAARECIYKDYRSKNTWGAYQTYGDPFYKLYDVDNVAASRKYIMPEEAETDLSNLFNDLKTGDLKKEEAEGELKIIIDEVERKALRTPVITELEATIYKSLNNYEEAIKKYQQLLYAENATYSFFAAEQYCNIRTKHLITQIDNQVVATAILEEFDETIADLEALVRLNPTAERYSLLASALKRKVYLVNPDADKAKDTIIQAAKNYLLAFNASNERDVYAYINWLSLSAILIASDKVDVWDKKDVDSIKNILKRLKENKSEVSPTDDFWRRIVLPNIELGSWILHIVDKKKSQMPLTSKVVDSYKEVWNQIGTPDEKQVEIQHLEILIQILKILNPDNHFGIPALIALKDELIRLLGHS